jgi:Mor family transcriptional regulator
MIDCLIWPKLGRLANLKLSQATEGNMTKGTFEARLVELLGEARAHDLIDSHRCEVLSIPRTINENHRLAQAVGMEVAAVLVAEWGGRRLSIPTGYARRIAARNQQIRAARANGVPVRALVRAFGLSPRTIYSITSPRNGAAAR